MLQHKQNNPVLGAGPFCKSAWLNIMADLHSFGMHECVENGF